RPELPLVDAEPRQTVAEGGGLPSASLRALLEGAFGSGGATRGREKRRFETLGCGDGGLEKLGRRQPREMRDGGVGLRGGRGGPGGADGPRARVRCLALEVVRFAGEVAPPAVE